MPDFAYTARNFQGEKVTGSLFAQSEREAIANLSTQQLFPLEVTQQKTAAQKSTFNRRVSGQTMAVTYSQLASLLRSGVPLLRSIGVIRDQSSHAVLKEVLDDVYRRVEEGTTLGEAMSRYPRVFSELAINMVKAGGEGGFLEEALDRVATFTEQYEDLKSRTTGALAYPIFLTVVGTAVVAVLIVFFVPKFASIFDSLRERGELPMMTDWLLWFSGAVRHYGWISAGSRRGWILGGAHAIGDGKWTQDCRSLETEDSVVRQHLSKSGRRQVLSCTGDHAAERGAHPEVP